MRQRSEFSLSAPIEAETREGRFHFRHLRADGQVGVLASSLREPTGPTPVRVHSSCLFSETLSTQDCDCESQLRHSISYLSRNGGHLVYLYDEGRGAGLAAKFRAIALQQTRDIDTAAAFAELGMAPDPRDFTVGADVIASVVGSRPVELLTNNPRKLAAFTDAGINLVGRISLVVPETSQARLYLSEKMRVLGHLPESDPAIRAGSGTMNQTLVELHTPDFAPVREFYTAMGFEVVWQRLPEQKKGYLVLAMAGNVVCFWAGNEYVYEHSYFRNFPRPSPRGYGTEIVLTVTDVRDYYDRFPHNSHVVAPLERRAWGVSDFRVVDPVGFYLRITEPHDILDPRHAVS
jgi:GTP cyclohydrolase II